MRACPARPHAVAAALVGCDAAASRLRALQSRSRNTSVAQAAPATPHLLDTHADLTLRPPLLPELQAFVRIFSKPQTNVDTFAENNFSGKISHSPKKPFKDGWSTETATPTAPASAAQRSQEEAEGYLDGENGALVGSPALGAMRLCVHWHGLAALLVAAWGPGACVGATPHHDAVARATVHTAGPAPSRLRCLVVGDCAGANGAPAPKLYVHMHGCVSMKTSSKPHTVCRLPAVAPRGPDACRPGAELQRAPRAAAESPRCALHCTLVPGSRRTPSVRTVQPSHT